MGVFTFQCFVLFLIFAFSCLSFSSFPLLLDFLKAKSGPSNEVSRHIYIYAVGSITWPDFGQSRVNNLAGVGSITWPAFFWAYKNRGFGRFFGAQFSGGGAKLVFLKKKIWSKKGFPKKKMCTFFWGCFGFTSLLLHAGTGCFRRVCKKPYKNRFFLSTLLLDAEETEKKEETKKKTKKKGTPKKWGALKKGRK